MRREEEVAGINESRVVMMRNESTCGSVGNWRSRGFLGSFEAGKGGCIGSVCVDSFRRCNRHIERYIRILNRLAYLETPSQLK